MIGLLIFVAVVVWFARQFHGARSARWSRRWVEWYFPIGRLLVSDARAIALAVSVPFRHRQAVRGVGNLDEEWRKLSGDA